VIGDTFSSMLKFLSKLLRKNVWGYCEKLTLCKTKMAH